MDYKTSGVDISSGSDVVRRIRQLAQSTFSPAVLSEIGSFGGLFQLDTARYQSPILVSSADGVGTKLRVAFRSGEHRTIGLDLVNHCVNDILAQGAEPLFFLDYLATGKLQPDVAVAVVEGVARACQENGCALLGGETAEMPGFYADGEYDLAGFIVGVVDKEQLIDGSRIEVGDRLVGIPSSGLHTNGYSLAQQIIFEKLQLRVDSLVAELGCSVGEALLQPHRSYLKIVRPVLADGLAKGIAHITGGGLTDNLPRILPEQTTAYVDRRAWIVPEIFDFLQKNGEISDREMYRTFNMGIGLVIVCAEENVQAILEKLRITGEPKACVIGQVVEGRGSVDYEDLEHES